MSVLINPTWWLLCGALAVTLLARDARDGWASGVRLASRTPVLLAIAAGVTFNLAGRGMLGHAVPGDFVQEVAAARSLRAGTALYPADVNAEVRAWLAEDPPPLPSWLPPPVDRWLETRQREGRNRLVAQAHPPTLLAISAPFILLLGPYGAYWALTTASIAAASIAALALVGVFAPLASSRERALAVLVVASWQPVLATIRDGQSSVIVAMLLIVGWRELRRDREVLGGLAVGAAAALKLYPLLVLVPLAVRRRRALAVALLVVVGAAGAALVPGGPGVWGEFAASARIVARSFADTSYNLSLVARLGVLGGTLAWVAYPALAAVLVGLTLGIVGQAPTTASPIRAVDVEFASFVTLALVLSPVAWHHYVAMLALPLAVLARAAWARGSRVQGSAVLALALVLSVPDDAWRGVWGALPAPATSVVSPGVAGLVLWAAVLRTGRRAVPGH